MTQKDLAELLKRPQSYVSKYESGERRLDLPEIEAICTAAGIDLFRFVRRYQRQQSGPKAQSVASTRLVRSRGQ